MTLVGTVSRLSNWCPQKRGRGGDTIAALSQMSDGFCRTACSRLKGRRPPKNMKKLSDPLMGPIASSSLQSGPFDSVIACWLALNSICNEAAIVVLVVSAKVQSGKIAAILPTTPPYCYYSAGDCGCCLRVSLWHGGAVEWKAGTISGDSPSTVCVNRNRIGRVAPQLKCRLRRCEKFSVCG